MKLRYITGRGGSAETGLSKYLAGKAQDYRGLSNNETLHRQAVDDQIRIVAEFASDASHLIANSYGCYLWLLSRISAMPSEARILLLSPVMGRAVDSTKFMSSRPPRLRGLNEAILESRLILPTSVSVYTGKEDPVCDYKVAVAQCERLGITDVNILEGQAHNLDHQTVEKIVDSFLG